MLILACAFKAAFSDLSCQKTKELDVECASYCYKAIKPMIQMATECHNKDAEISKLKDQLAELKKQIAVWVEKESQSNKQMKLISDVAEIKANIENIATHLNKNDGTTSVAKNPPNAGQRNLTAQAKETIVEKITEQYADNCENSVGIQTIQVKGISEPFQVFCDSITSDYPWIVMQRRVSRTVDFNKDWKSFSHGFGDVDGNYFIGLDKVYRLTSTQPYELYIHMESFKGQIGYARYSYFKISGYYYNYQLLELGNFKGNVSNAMSESLKAQFSNYEKDNDNNYRLNCAKMHESAWWFRSCPASSNLNGRYADFEIDNAQGIWWKDFGEGHTLKSVKMLIRPAH
ncbi:hypothetical protein ACLKA7_013505 [Drosophila subpalustris]